MRENLTKFLKETVSVKLVPSIKASHLLYATGLFGLNKTVSIRLEENKVLPQRISISNFLFLRRLPLLSASFLNDDEINRNEPDELILSFNSNFIFIYRQ